MSLGKVFLNLSAERVAFASHVFLNDSRDPDPILVDQAKAIGLPAIAFVVLGALLDAGHAKPSRKSHAPEQAQPACDPDHGMRMLSQAAKQ
jgi:hypothetical protein